MSAYLKIDGGNYTTITGLHEMTGLHRKTILNWIKQGKITAIDLLDGYLYLISEKEARRIIGVAQYCRHPRKPKNSEAA
jgi:predicted site-specific integrase-resolvase